MQMERNEMHRRLIIIIIIIILLLFIFTAADDPDHISINCGGGAAPATAPSGRQWGGDAAAPKGASTVKAAVDPVPYGTARISRSQFSYSFQLSPGQKFIRLHFNPVSYHGFQSFHDLFSVEAGPFTLLANFSASITARALSLNLLAKEFCIIVQHSQPLNIVFSPETRYNYAFINGIEIISVPSTISYCHGGDAGVHVLGQKSVIYVDNTTALERVYHQNVKWGGSVLDDFGKWASNLKQNANKVYNNRSWRVSVDVGFRYLIRIHLCEVGVDNMDFRLLIDNMIALSSADDIHLRNQSILWYNYMVMVEGHKREGKRTISVSLNSQQNFLEGFEVFKLSNHDRSLASPNPPLPPTPTPDSPSHTVQTLLHYSPIARRNAIATVVFAVICLLNIIVHLLLKMWGAETTEEENKPSARAKPLCRTFSLAEIRSATDNFHSGFIIGKGGFGNVYKGFMDNGREIVAIKRSKPGSKQGELQFWTEVETLSELRHVNLVSLIGYCIEQKEMILVYEYMPDGTLADHLYKLARKSKDFYPLSWKQRLKICIGAARALDYLHTGHGIIHRDVKASNILFDGNFVAKFSDFGLAKTGGFSESQSQDSTNLKGTFGYIDPNFFTTRKLTKESDMYSFGVVLLEVLCGRAAVEPWNIEEEKRSLTTWAIDNISKGQVDHIVAPSLRGEISPDSLKTFVKVAERCLLDEPKKRPAAAHVVIKLELALQRQEKADSLAPKELTSFEDVFSSTHKSQKENMNFSVPSEKVNGSDALHQKEKARSSAQDEIRNVTDNGHRTILSFSPRAMSSSFNVQDYTSLRREQSNSTMINSGRKDGKKSMMHRITRKLWPPLDLFRKTRKPSNKTDLVGMSVSAPLLRRTSNTTLGGNNITNKRKDGLSSTPTLRIFSIEELKAATRNFRSDTVLGEGGFGTVYKGWIHENSSAKEGSASIVAVKKLDHEGQQGFKEWQSEVQFLGRLSHPNLVKLLGYGWDNQDLFLVYEFMQKGSLENHLFRRSHQPLSWDIRLNILIGAARGLAFLHSSDIKIIYRDFKSSNILLDEWYHAKISDFGLAKTGPFADNTHVSTQVMGTHGYAAPEYIMTGHLTTKSDVYGFGVVLLEVVTGLRVIDKGRPAEECNLVVWTKAGRKLKKMIDPRMEGRYAPKSAAQVGELAFNCLQYNPKTRPTMQQVVHTLEQAILDAKPKQPRVVRFSPQPRPS